MIRINNPARCKPDILAITAGLAWAQLIAFLAIYLSNAEIHRSTTAMLAEGWFAIPTGAALDPLMTPAAAFQGAFFFTLSVGAGLSLATWAAVRLWRYFFPNGKRWYWGVVAGAAVLAAFLNARGWVWFPSVLGAGVIVVTGLLSGAFSLPQNRLTRWWVPVAVLLFLTGMWITWAVLQTNTNMFISIRDRLLLSNPIGSKVNDFYYRNTLYAAEIFKSFNQKTLRTCRFEGSKDATVTRRLTAVLAARNVLVIHEDIPVDLTIRFIRKPDDQAPLDIQGQSLILITKTNRKVPIDLAGLMGDPNHWLTKVSDVGDRYGPFRRLIFVTLLIGFPILLYTLVYGIVRWISALFFSTARVTWAASGICLGVGILLFLPVALDQSIHVAEEEINTVFKTDAWPQRVAAMQRIERKNLDIVRFPAYRELLQGSTVVERYYLARVLALSSDAATYRDLLSMLNDPHPNVVCQVFYALGRRGQKAAIPLIINNIKQSAHWYTQWYGYGALRNLGWRQNNLK